MAEQAVETNVSILSAEPLAEIESCDEKREKFR
jgi:hypothetical protein